MIIQTHYVRKPIPTDAYDWCAFVEPLDLDSHIGYGRTAQAAILDLDEYLPERKTAMEIVEESLQVG